MMRYLLAGIFFIAAAISIGDGFINYNNYRKTYVKLDKKKEKVAEENEKVEVPTKDDSIIIDETNTEQPQNYVS